MTYEIEGKLIQKKDTQKVSETFRKREFVVEITELVNGEQKPNYIKFDTNQDRCEVLNGIEIGSIIKVRFNIRGRKWEKDGVPNYFNSLEAWNISIVYQKEQATAPETTTNKDDLPF